jgi:hypothetical protein
MKKLFLILITLFVFFTAKVFALEPIFDYVDSDWIQPLEQNMDNFWQMMGLQETGTNYYSCAGGGPYWERFNPNNPRYQAWFGVYVVDNFEFASDWPCGDKLNSVNRAVELTMYDQIAWLTYYGNPSPHPTLKENSLRYYKKRNGWYSVNYILKSSSDLGGPINPELPIYPGYSIYENLVEPYQEVILYCHLRIKYDIRNKQFLVIYSSVSKYQLLDGTWKDPTWSVFSEIYLMMKNVTFQ